jgi:hypothetical protein
VSTRSEYQYGLLVEFTDQEAERAYQPHATHLVVVGHYKKIAPNANDILASIDVNDYFDAAK